MKQESYRKSLEASADKERHRRSPYEKFRRIVRQNIKGVCLEIGSGDGSWSGFLKECCGELVSVDLSEKRVSLAKSSCPGAHFSLCDARSLPFKDASFDSVCVFEVIEHLPEPGDHDKLLAEARRVLKQDGALFISTPNRPLFRFYCAVMKENHPTHFTEISYRRFKALLGGFFPRVDIYGNFGWLAPFFKFSFMKYLHAGLSALPFCCKSLMAVCRNHRR